MGLFRKRNSETAPVVAETPTGPVPIDKASIDLDAARSLTIDLCNAIGSHQRMSAATSRLMSMSGMHDPDRALRAMMSAFQDEGPSYLTKLWRWLAAVAERANEVGEHEVAVRAYWWATNWIYSIQPTLGTAGAVQLGFDAAPSGIHATLVREAERALPHLSDEFVVAITAEPATITVGPLRGIVAEQVKAGGDLPVDQAVMLVMSNLEAEAKRPQEIENQQVL